ncbi:MAG: protein-glutamate O-methyltransferase CheR [Ignavibacteria bacterium]
MNSVKIEEIELKLLLEGIYQMYDYDFRDYSPASIKRRVHKCMGYLGVKSVSALQDKVLHEKKSFGRFLETVSVNVTSMFRDPDFFLAVRQSVFPMLTELPFIRIWHAGCAAGEEVYSMAIMLKEENLYDKVRIYATDMNESALETARNGIYSLYRMQDYAVAYQKAGGRFDFSQYFRAKYDNIIMNKELNTNIVWARHNLATDGSFNEFDIIICRNVMIYFDKQLQERVYKLFTNSLTIGGILGLGKKETIKSSDSRNNYAELDAHVKLYKRILSKQ